MSELTRGEREGFARLSRALQVERGEEERTVERLRGEGLLVRGDGRTVTGDGVVRGEGPTRPALRWPWPARAVRVALAVAAGVACYLAGLWSEREGVWTRRGGTPRDSIAMAQVAAPIIRF